MYVNSTLIAMAVVISSVLGTLPVQAQGRVTNEGQRLHRLCDGGDKERCLRSFRDDVQRESRSS